VTENFILSSTEWIVVPLTSLPSLTTAPGISFCSVSFSCWGK
jgi:hypothetical protein